MKGLEIVNLLRGMRKLADKMDVPSGDLVTWPVRLRTAAIQLERTKVSLGKGWDLENTEACRRARTVYAEAQAAHGEP